MKIDEKGTELSTLNDILNAYELQLQSKYGSDFYIKPEGVIDNIASSAGFMEMSLQEQIAFLTKQFDPETAEDCWQDALYERIGVYRIEAEATIFTKKILGTPGYTAEVESVTIRQESSGDEFVNSGAFTVEEDGSAAVNFKCVVTGKTKVSEGDSFSIVEAPNEITEISAEPAYDIAAGRDRETDSEYRVRFKSAKAQNAKATRNANEANLLRYVDNIAFLKIIDKKNDNSFEAGTLQIIAKHNTTDEIFAQAVFETVADGIDLLGDTSKIVKDDSGEDVLITFKRASEPEIYITGTLKIRNGYYPNTVIAAAKQNILKYIENRIFGLEAIIYATEFIIPMLQTDGVEAVLEVEIKNGEDGSFTDSIQLERDEAPAFSPERITLIESEV